MTRPIDETWDPDDVVNIAAHVAYDEPRRHLASAAPDMARVLLDIEWSGYMAYVGDGGYACCPSCEGIDPDFAGYADAKRDVDKGDNVVGHRENCELDAAIRKAGIR